MTITCAKCGRELPPPVDRHYVEVSGWEKPGRGLHGRSGSSLVLRGPTGRIACAGCITAEQYGVTPAQMTLEGAP